MKAVVGTIAPATTEDLGQLLSASEIAERFYRGKPSVRWVREKMKAFGLQPQRIGAFHHWYEGEVRQAIIMERVSA
jgi:hypothetical protein